MKPEFPTPEPIGHKPFLLRRPAAGFGGSRQ